MRSLARWHIASFWIWGLALAGALLVLDRCRLAGRSVIKITGIDTICYFSTAHSMASDGDFDLRNQFAALGYEPQGWCATRPESGLPGSPFAIGYSVLQIPFVGAGILTDRVAGHEPAGFSWTAMAIYFLGNIVLLCAGMTFTYLLLRRVHGERTSSGRESAVAWASWAGVFLVWPSTTLCYYTFAPVVHVASFACAALFLLAWWSAKDGFSLKRWAYVGLSGGLLALSRWEAVLFFLLPAVHDAFRWVTAPQWRRPRDWAASRAVAGLAAAGLFSLQMIQWRVIYGSFVTIPQGGGFFEFPPRYILEVLFSTQHGWFAWTPAALIGLLGVVAGIRRRGMPYACLLIPAVVFPVLLGAQPTNWHQSESFGARILTYCVPIVAVGIAGLLLQWKRAGRMGLLLALGCASAYTLIFALQFRLDLIPNNDRLTPGELLRDKVRIVSAVQRRVAAGRAESALREGRWEEAFDMASKAGEVHGHDRMTIEVMLQAAVALEDEDRRCEIEDLQRRLLDGRWF